MILAYRWARKKYQQRQQGRDDEPLQPPPINTVEVPVQPPTEATTVDGATKETSRSNSPANAAVQEGSSTANNTAKSGAKTEKPEATPEEKAEQRRKRAYRWKIVIGLFAPFTLQSLDTTIIASALPFIASDFSKQPLRSRANRPYFLMSRLPVTSTRLIPTYYSYRAALPA